MFAAAIVTIGKLLKGKVTQRYYKDKYGLVKEGWRKYWKETTELGQLSIADDSEFLQEYFIAAADLGEIEVKGLIENQNGPDIVKVEKVASEKPVAISEYVCRLSTGTSSFAIHIH